MHDKDGEKLQALATEAEAAGLDGAASVLRLAADGFVSYGLRCREEWLTAARALFEAKVIAMDGERQAERLAIWRRASAIVK